MVDCKQFLESVRAAVSSEAVRDDADALTRYGRDWTRVYEPNPAAVLFPRHTQDVAAMMRLASTHKVAIVPSGGRTGYAGGAVAARGEVVLSLEKLTHLGPVDGIGETVVVGAGAITEAVHAHVGVQGLCWPIDFASKGSSQIGGNIATNAGGVKVIRYGLTRQWVLGLQVVLADGRVLDLGGALEKNNTGLDLRQLFIGTEGTLGIVTAATLKLTRLPQAQRVLLFALHDLAAVLALFRRCRQGPFRLAAYEFFTAACAARLEQHRRLRPPFSAPAAYYVLLEVQDAAPGFDAWVAEIFDSEVAQDGVLAQTSSQARELWQLREGISEALAATGLPHKNDIALPLAALGAFCGDFAALCAARYPGWEICLFGHIGDGNLHVNVMQPKSLSKEEFLRQTAAVDADLFSLVAQHHGSISAEHGIGLLKKPYLHHTRSAAELVLLRQFKAALDPQGILNPGKIFD